MKKILKRCEKCKGTSLVTPRERRCKRQAFGPRSYACWGRLVREKEAKRGMGRQVRDVRAEGDGVPGGASALRQKPRPQDHAAEQVAKAKRMSAIFQERLAEEARKIARTAQQLKKWEGRLARYAALAARTDAEVEADRKARQERAKRPKRIRRGIEL